MEDKDRQRLVTLLGMMGSNHDGEILNAAKAAQKLVTNLKITWAEAITPDAFTADQMLECARMSYAKGLEDGKASQLPQTKPVGGGGGSVWNQLARTFISDHDLSEWEEEFFNDWTMNRYSPTDKQRAVFIRACEKYGEKYPGRV